MSDFDLSLPDFVATRDAHVHGHLEAACCGYRELLIRYPGEPCLLTLLGTVHLQLGAADEGVELLKQSLLLREDQPYAHLGLGQFYSLQGQFELALKHLDRAVILAPMVPEAQGARADTLNRLGRVSEALEAIASALYLRPESAEFSLFQGTLYLALGRYEEGLGSINRALSLRPDFPEATYEMARALFLQGKLYQDREELSLAVNSYNEAIILAPDFFEAYINRGNSWSALGRFMWAIADHSEAIRLRPEDAVAYANRGSVYEAMGKYTEALNDFFRAKQLPHCPLYLDSSMLFAALKTWRFMVQTSIFEDGILNLDAGISVGAPFPYLSYVDDPVLHRRIAEFFIRSKWCAGSNFQVFSPKTDSKKTVLAYFSSDFRDHPVALNLLPVIKAHDRERFEVTAFDFTPEDGFAPRHEILGVFDRVYRVGSLSDSSVVDLSRSLGIDIAIDLNGHTQHARTGLFMHRVAPIQVNYLGYPGTMGTEVHDFMIADSRVIPDAHRGDFSERVLRLPHFFMPYSFDGALDGSRARRADFGLPEGRFIFCSFNDFYKISEAVFKGWMEILKRTEGPILYVALRGDLDREQFLDRVQAFDVSMDRIVVAERVASREAHLERLSLCDLMLDTFPYGSHTTACDAVFSGLPLLTIRGRSFASRVSSSLLEELGLMELVMEDVPAYVDRAIELSEVGTLHQALRSRLVAGRRALPTSLVYTRNLESLYMQMLEKLPLTT